MRYGGRQFILFSALACIGCTADHGPKVVDNPDIEAKIPAIKQVALTHQLRKADKLVAELESDDPAVRFYAISALQKLTGQTKGYLYYTDEEQRQPALLAWQHWLAQQHATTHPATTQPAITQEARR